MVHEPGTWYACADGHFPDINVPVIAGYWFQDTWMKGDPWVWLQNVCFMAPNSHPDFNYCDHKMWCNSGFSHNAITHWCYPPAPPPHP